MAIRALHSAMMAVALAAAVPTAAQSVQAGIEAWQRRDYAQALGIWRPMAESGDADAAFNLGQAYRLGRGVPLDLAAAQTWLERAARKDHVEAQSTLGLLLYDSGNRTGGLRWLRAAADGGEPRALLVYGTALFNGDGVKRDPILAYAYVSRAAAQGFGPAKPTLEDLDRLLSLEQRQQGVAVALSEAKAKPVAPAVAEKPKAQAKAKPAAASPAPATGGWRVQLGAFSRRSSAEALFGKLAKGTLAGLTPHYVPAGAMTRLQAGPFASRAAAATASARLAKSGQACLAVPGK